MSNDPRLLIELKRWEASFIMDSLHNTWSQYVSKGAVAKMEDYSAHVWEWRKRTASRLLNLIDDKGYEQGFYEDGVGL